MPIKTESIKITNKYLTDITWLDISACTFDVGDHIDIWKVKVGSNIPLVDNFLKILKPDEIARANRFYQLKDRNRFIISRGILLHVMGKYLKQSPFEVEFTIGENNKPYIKKSNPLNLQYNLSH